MTDTFVLELLPARGLDQSMLLPVLVGLMVVLVCTETLGWVFAGAVVPGYLASVLIIQPVTGGIVIFESLLTLAISAALAKVLSRTDAWTRFFGRERFFLILVVSLIVRMHDHAWFAPWAIGEIDELFGTQYETQQEFYSVGLVLVPLTANMLWKPALHRGLAQLGIQVGITFLLVNFVLLPYTNLSLSSVELTYENAAINFVGHAKAHIILLTAALLAAQFNLTYGWDFNGILVPALLAMLWLTPLKLAATLGEAMIVLYLTKGFLKLPVIRHLDFEGPRKIVLVFTLAFLWKVALGFSLAPWFPNLKISDTYGFGYLLSSLLAVKMLSVKSVRAVMLPSLFASAGGFVIGSLIGYLLDVVRPQLPPDEDLTQPQSSRLASNPLGVMTLARIDYDARPGHPEPMSATTRGWMQHFWTTAATLQREVGDEGAGAKLAMGARVARGLPSDIDALRSAGSVLGLQVVSLGRYPMGLADSSEAGANPGTGPKADARPRREWLAIVADDSGRRRGLVTGLLIPGAQGPVLVVPMPWSEAPVAEAAAVACRRVDCRAVLVAGRERHTVGTPLNPRPLELAMQAFDADMVVLRADVDAPQRGFVGQLVADLEGSKALASPPGPEPRTEPAPGLGRASARIHQLRGYFDLVALWPDYEIDWEPHATVVRMPAGDSDFVLLRSTPARFEAFVIDGAAEFEPALAVAPERRLEPDHLLELLIEIDEHREPAGTAGKGYRAPSGAELLVLEQLVVEPLMRWADDLSPGRPLPGGVRVRAAELDYELVELGNCAQPGPGCLVMLRERSRPSTSGWGTLVVRRDARAKAHVVEVPRPHRERQTWRVGAEMWQLLDGRALLIAGADGLPRDPRAASEGTERDSDEIGALPPNPDPVRTGNLETPFHAIHQGIDRTAKERFEFVQLRGLASFRPVSRDVILGMGLPVDGLQEQQDCWGLLRDDLRLLVEIWDSCQVADGSEDLYFLSGAGVPQLEYSRELGSGEGRVLWLSAGLRERYAAQRTTSVDRSAVMRGLRQAHFAVPSRHEVGAMLEPLWSRDDSLSPNGHARVPVGRPGYDQAVAWAIGFAETGNLHLLRSLDALRNEAVDVRVSAALGLDFGHPFIIIDYVGLELGKRAVVILDHSFGGKASLSFAEFGSDPSARLRTVALARPQLLVIEDIEVQQLPELAPAPDTEPPP
ncbi:poly-gamma-glutamate biosynthesis protein PgsC/CapC [Enhygromyxa salina]|uniref:Uncharacterized protein n=1 Tax=Enhygromyxa salina TaxID=215803 RepID=A0A2S9YRH0_9BACT|nr:poly-gamma-glutamate biosynthesis protein PgsC/CapC [Enhygromyxa salina]PRQ07694.1 hypothetical protein ENSA7_26840 [Enhygromyxa salina]